MNTDDQWTCGKGLAAHSPLPAALGELMASVAAVLEAHMNALDLADDNSRKEHDAYRTLVQAHREIAAQLEATADQMAGYRDLPMGRHDANAWPRISASYASACAARSPADARGGFLGAECRGASTRR